jgi:hypothetical protein
LTFSAPGQGIGLGSISIWPVDYDIDAVAFGDSTGCDAFSDGSFRVGSIVPHKNCSKCKQRYNYGPPHSIPLLTTPASSAQLNTLGRLSWSLSSGLPKGQNQRQPEIKGTRGIATHRSRLLGQTFMNGGLSRTIST